MRRTHSKLPEDGAPAETVAATLLAAIEAAADACCLLRPIRDAGGGIADFRCAYANRRSGESPFAAHMPAIGATVGDALAAAPALEARLLSAYRTAALSGQPGSLTVAAAPGVWLSHSFVAVGDALWVSARDISAGLRDLPASGAGRDSSAITSAEDKVRQAEEALSDAIETLTVGFILYGPDRRVLACNERLIEMFPENAALLRGGATFNELQRNHIATKQPHLSAAEVERRVEERARDFDKPQSTFEYQLPGNRWVLVSERRTRAGGLVGTRTDITEIKRREEALSVLLDHPASGADTFGLAARALATGLGYRFAGVGLISADGERVELQAFWSGDRLGEPISYPLPNSPCGMVCHSRRLCFYPAAVTEQFPQAALLRQLGAVSYIGDIFHDKDGNAVGHVFALNDAPDTDGPAKRAIVHLIAGWVGLEHQRRLAEAAMAEAKEQAERANLSKSLFLANIGHELRTPLNAIIGFSQMLSAGYGGELKPRQAEYMRDIEASGAHLLLLVNDLLDLSKAEAGRLELSETVFPLADTFAAVRRFLREQAVPAAIRLEVTTPPPSFRLMADELKLRQILLNLLSNALKFTPAGGTVTLDAAVDADGGATIRVRDTGIGIASADIERAFTSFVQLQSPLTSPIPGTGLGLPLSRALAELHGGRLTLESTQGEGTTATLRLPPARVRADG
jgi:signal transduction histidine kinase/PAS domain-containing protein